MYSSAPLHPLGNSRDACTGCGACAAKCPKRCIDMHPDSEGFLHPRINTGGCLECGLCCKTCPVNFSFLPDGNTLSKPLRVFAAWHLDKTTRYMSSSGGVFSALADNILSQGGVVVGAAFDNQLFVHQTIVDTASDLYRLRGSKYVQSQFSPALYKKIINLLKQGRLVLFSGTPCQVAGLHSFLQEPYKNLFCCDLVCHGTPSPLLWANYIQYIQIKADTLINISFRDKTTGWKNYVIRHQLRNGRSKLYSTSEDSYIVAYLRNYSLRPSCYTCPFTNTNRLGDLTIADFWGVSEKYPEYDCDDKGTSLVLVNTKKGSAWLNDCKTALFIGPADLDTAIAGNPMLRTPSTRPPERNSFYNDLEKLSFQDLVRAYKLYAPSRVMRIITSIKRKLAGIFCFVDSTTIGTP